MIVREAEWTWAEMQDFNRLIQRYRYTYVAALFVSTGWVLGHALQQPGGSLVSLITRTDVAAILCILPMVNALFALLTLEATFKVQSLARYRFILGLKLGGGEPLWRWELFRRDNEEGSIRQWENPTNVLLALLVLIVTGLSLGLARQAVYASTFLNALWWVSVVFCLTVVTAAAIAGIKRIDENDVADPVDRPYDALRLRPKKPPTLWQRTLRRIVTRWRSAHRELSESGKTSAPAEQHPSPEDKTD